MFSVSADTELGHFVRQQNLYSVHRKYVTNSDGSDQTSHTHRLAWVITVCRAKDVNQAMVYLHDVCKSCCILSVSKQRVLKLTKTSE